MNKSEEIYTEFTNYCNRTYTPLKCQCLAAVRSSQPAYVISAKMLWSAIRKSF